jgi:hypothetical protein
LVFFLFCCITTCNLNGFLFGFNVMNIHKIVQIGEVKVKKISCFPKKCKCKNWKVVRADKSNQIKSKIYSPSLLWFP